MSYPQSELIYNRTRHGQLMQETVTPSRPAPAQGVSKETIADCRHWLEAIQKGTSPLVKPEQALVVTRILEGIYRAAEQNREIRF